MTNTMGTTPGGTPPTSDASTRDVAKEEARGVAQDAVQSGRQTADTAKQQAGQVAGEAMSQARTLLDQTREQLTTQGSAQQEKAASGLHSLADELTGMLNGEGAQSGLAADLTQQVSEHIRTAAQWLETREPSDVLADVRGFARQRPGVFLLSAAAVGFLGGRLTRGIAADARESRSNELSSTGYAPAPALSTAPNTAPVTGLPPVTPTAPDHSTSPVAGRPAQAAPSVAGDLGGTAPGEERI